MMTTPSSKSDDMMEEEEARHSADEEEEEGESGVDSLEEMQKRRSIQSGRGVTLSMLMSDGILEAGEGFLTIDYLGAKFVGDLLPGGKIRAQETQKVFSSPSSWAIHCKKLLNPDKKSGCGWSSMRYKGKKLDTYKNLWFRKHKQQEQENNAQQSSSGVSGVITKPCHGDHSIVSEDEKKCSTPKKWDLEKIANMVPRPRPSSSQKRIIVPHSVLGNRSFAHDLNTLVKCTPFSGLDRIQPFTVTIATNCLLLVDFHCHIIKNEVVGYLGGNWDIASHNLAVLQAFPCRSGLGDKDSAARVEDEIRRSLERRHLSVVGWYHSHPTFPAQPTIKDVDSQMEYQITMKGDSDSSYTPCLGLICSPYDTQRPSMEADYLAYWVMPPPEHRPHEYGRPMQMIYSIAHDSFLTQDLLMEMRLISEYYRSTGEAIDFNVDLGTPQAGGSHWEKLQSSLRTKLPRDLMVTGAQSTAQAQAVTHFWDFLKGLIMT
ncbi:MPN domain-containing protein isoform X2 [Parasteatoda tepidariorum]|uniref:MPN domain-containing protein isoform X2 n=1 Tax=Parasteatoda tepidariorum TaxID=114398 RepID=UPI00077FC790|nr:MPN domain-containing protein isoform X3 [Parasteatoda tepidariorum]